MRIDCWFYYSSSLDKMAETDRLLSNRQKESMYDLSRWFYLQLIPLGIISWKEKKNDPKPMDDVTELRDDIENHYPPKRNKKAPLLDDNYRLKHQQFDLSKSRRRYYFALSSMFLILTAVATTFLFFFNMIEYFGQTSRIIHFISMTTYSINLLLLPIGCAISRFYFYFIGKENISALDCCSVAWCLWMFLEESFVVRRIRFLPLASDKRPYPFSSFLVISFVICVVTGYMAFVVYYKTPKDTSCDVNMDFLLLNALAGSIGAAYFALFCNYVHVLRTSLREELIFLIKYCYCNEGDLASCRRRIVSMVRDYRVIRSVTNLWMQVVLPASVLGLVVHLKWNYLVFTSSSQSRRSDEDLSGLVLMSIYIFMCKLMVTCLPLLALGGTDLQYMWNEMRLTLSLIQQSHAERFWKETLKFIQKLNPHGTEEWVASVALSVIGVYLGLKVGTQDVDYYCSQVGGK